jgi:pantoate--beta-alanine ligase
MQTRADTQRLKKRKIALVPTMGYFHEGHLTLMRKGRQLGDELVVSLFVNPTQFGPDEDFETYPRDTDRDLELARKAGVDVLFMPETPFLYPDGFQTFVNLNDLPQHLCGLSRPNFFQGVATVVTKLFNIVKPHVAIFGEKDYQQLAVIRRMVKDLNLDIDIIGAETVREPDGLAMSSRNAYLAPAQRTPAISLFLALTKAKEHVAKGETDAGRVIAAATETISSHPDTVIDYITICDPNTLQDKKTIKSPVIMALAVKVGQTRLIDNMRLMPPETA